MRALFPAGMFVLLCSGWSSAQQANPIEEIIVTAQHVEESLQTVPLAASGGAASRWLPMRARPMMSPLVRSSQCR